jgi:poly(3-hydroxybutyrate) depolymerase
MRNVLLLLLLAVVPVRADDLLLRLRTAAPDEVDAVVRAVLEAKPDRAEIAARLAKALPVSVSETGWRNGEAVDARGVARPFEFYVPKSITGKSDPVPLLVHMHGGVARADWFPNPGQRSSGGMWIESAEEEGFVVAFPSGRNDCMWWSEAGAANVRAVVREVKRHAPIHDDAIIGTGFSDGGSGSYYLAMAEPGPFAAFLPLNGHFAVAASASGENLYLDNLARTPLFVAATQDDSLYPAASLLPHVRAAMEAGASLHLVSYPRGGHRPVYFTEQRAAMTRFVVDTRRDPLPRSIRWRCADPRLGKVDWLEITSIGESESDPEATEDVNVLSTPGRVRIGISLDSAYEGEGVRVDRVTEGSVAENLGLKQGDVLVAMDKQSIRGFGGLRALLDAKSPGDPVAFTLRSGEESRDVEGRFPEFVARPVYRRAGLTARIELESESNRIVVRCRNVREFRLRLSPLLYGDGEIALSVNGKRVAPTIETIPLEGILRDYAREADAGRVFTRVATVVVP